MLGVTLMLAFGTFGCASQPVNVIGQCPLPAHYDVVKPGPAPLTAADLKTHLEQEAAERHQHKQDNDDYNGLVSFVKSDCQTH